MPAVFIVQLHRLVQLAPSVQLVSIVIIVKFRVCTIPLMIENDGAVWGGKEVLVAIGRNLFSKHGCICLQGLGWI